MFGRATIRLGIGPHSSYIIFYFSVEFSYIILSFYLQETEKVACFA